MSELNSEKLAGYFHFGCTLLLKKDIVQLYSWFPQKIPVQYPVKLKESGKTIISQLRTT